MDTTLVDKKTNYADRVEVFSTRIITEEFSDRLVYHNIENAKRIQKHIKQLAEKEPVNGEELEDLLIAGWMSFVGWKHVHTEGFETLQQVFEDCHECSIMQANEYLPTIGYPESRINNVAAILEDTQYAQEPKSQSGKILSDAIAMNWSGKKGLKRVKQLYQEMLLLGVISVSQEGYYKKLIPMLQRHSFYTSHGREVLEDKKDDLIREIEKEKKVLNKRGQLALQKELGINDEELKRLRKNLKSVSGRDDRGIQTMFRTTSRNHYTLNQMVDRKANIMISINAILLSIITTRIVGQIDTFCIHNSPILIMLISSVISIVFAILAILPPKSHGTFSEDEVRSKKGNLLYFGNYHDMSFKDYSWGMLQMMNDGEYLYTTMIRDLYFLGQMLQAKSRAIRRSLGIFMFGIIVTVVMFMLVSSMSDFHFGSANH